MRRVLAVLVFLTISLLARAQQVPSTPSAGPSELKLQGLEQFINQVREDWRVPGIAIVVVQHGKAVLADGFGYRNMEKKLPVTTKTMFPIGSITKSFTALSLAILNDEGKLDWDKPVREYMPSFRLHDPVASEHITPRDLLTHRSGLPRHDLVWYSHAYPRKEMVEHLRYLEPNKDFRSTYQYNNLMFLTAGYLAGELSGLGYEGLVRQRILLPLEMKTSTFSGLESQRSTDFALPYEKREEGLKEIPFHPIEEIAPAGGLVSNVEDMTHYLLLQLNDGKYGDRRILSEDNVRQMQSPQTVMGGTIRYPEFGHNSYAMGWVVTSYRGHKLVWHNGSIDGYYALLTFLPQDKIGMVILTNRQRHPAAEIISYNIFDRLLGLDQVAWNQRFKEAEEKQKQSEEQAKKKGYTIRKPGTHPAHDLKEYAGTYQNPGYGTVTIAVSQDGLRFTLNKLSAPLQHFHYEVFEIADERSQVLKGLKLCFNTNLNGDIESVAIPLETRVPEIVFTRVPEKLDRALLESLAGQYQLGPTVVTFSVDPDGTMSLNMAGQPKYELVPEKGLTFDIKGLFGFTVEFKKDDAGVSEVVFYQPNGTFVANKK